MLIHFGFDVHDRSTEGAFRVAFREDGAGSEVGRFDAEGFTIQFLRIGDRVGVDLAGVAGDCRDEGERNE